MKRFILISLAAVLLFSLAACQRETQSPVSQTETTAEQTPIVKPTPIPYEELQTCDTPPSGEIFIPWESIEDIPQVCYDMAVYSSLNELISDAAYIFTATVADVEVEVLSEKEDWDTKEPVHKTKVWYRLNIGQNIKGDILADGSAIYEFGHRYGEFNFFHEYFPPMCYGSTYLIFADEDKRLCKPFVGYTEILDGKMVSTQYNSMLGEQEIDDVAEQIKLITTAMDAPEELSIDKGIQSMLQAISTEPDFTPSRDLTTDEIDLMYRFYNDALAEEYQGKELSNGDIVIWVKTVRLTEQQMDVYQTSVGAATAEIAEAKGNRYKVTATRFHTLITICKCNEDNGTIHDAFSDLLGE